MSHSLVVDHDSVALSPNESRVRDYFLLLKPRVMTLVVFSGVVGLLLAPGTVHPFIAMVAILCIALGSGAAGAINMWYDRDIDLIMERTKKRPIPSGRVEPDEALFFGIAMSAASVLTMAVAVNMMAAVLLLTAILFYVFVYTIWLKRSTPQNIVIGGAAGAFPPMIGWAAVTGDVSLFSFLLFAIIFMWTPPHFWALALYKNTDYTKANVPMMPVVAGIPHTQKLMLIYTVLLLATTLLPWLLDLTGPLYALIAVILGLKFLKLAWDVYRDPAFKKAPKMFGYSIAYLFLILSALVLDSFIISIPFFFP